MARYIPDRGALAARVPRVPGSFRVLVGAVAAGLDGRVGSAGRLPSAAALPAVAALLAIVWAVVSIAGTRTALPHLFYVPILLSAMMLGVRGAVPTPLPRRSCAGPWCR
jgi:hypothetical protein